MAVERPTATVWTPEGQRLVDTSKSEVFYGLRTLDLSPAGAEILSYIVKHPTIDTIIVMGEPGANKTTVLYQMVRELNFLLGPDQVRFEECLYDQVMKSSAQAMGVPRPEWKPENWVEFSNRLYEELRAPMPPDNRRIIRVSEIVGLSLPGSTDRGVTALKRIAQDIRGEDPDAPKTLIIAIPADIRSQNRAELVRSAVLKADPSEVYKLLVDVYKIIPEGEGIVDTPEGGAKIKHLVSLMAGVAILQKAQGDVMHEIATWYGEISRERARAVEKLLLPESAANMSSVEKIFYQLRASHLDSLLHEQYGLPKDQTRVLFSQFTPDKIVHWYLSMPS